MKTRFLMFVAAGLVACSTTSAQPTQAASAAGCGPRPGASAPAAGCPDGRVGTGGMRVGMGPGARWGRDYTPGWPLMTPAERQQHQDKLRTLKTHEECRAYIDQHHEQMAVRAKDKGQALPARPRRDACAGLPAAKQ